MTSTEIGKTSSIKSALISGESKDTKDLRQPPKLSSERARAGIQVEAELEPYRLWERRVKTLFVAIRYHERRSYWKIMHANTFAEMAKNAEAFIDALGLTKVDVLGFSIGSMISQLIALDRPDLVHRLVIVGSGPRNGDHMAEFTPEANTIFGTKYVNLDDFWIAGFFTPSPESKPLAVRS